MTLLNRLIPALMLLTLLNTSARAQDTIANHTDTAETVIYTSVPTRTPHTAEVSFSLFPFITTHNVNEPVDVSLGLFGALSHGVKAAQWSMIANMNYGDLSYVQFAGISNINTGNITAVQIGGIANMVGGDVKGVQIAGITNIAHADVEGSQISGIVGITKQRIHGTQVGGIANYAGDTVIGSQIAGLCNEAVTDVQGAQVSGFYNHVQGTIQGTQVSGFLNVAHNVRGSQIGFINISDSIQGIPVGFLSYSRSGYHKLEVFANELFLVNAAFHTGAKSFHNIISAGLKPSSDGKLLWYAGYGVGSAMSVGKKTNILINLSGNQISKGDVMRKMNLLNKGFIGVEYQLTKKVAFVAGPELNALFTNTDYSEYPDLFTEVKPDVFYHERSTKNNLDVKMWIGAKAGLRFF